MVISNLRVLDDAITKIKKYDKYDRERISGRYNQSYRDLLNARQGNSSLVDINGVVNDYSIKLIEKTLIAFEMKKHGQMDNKFNEKLKRKLRSDDDRVVLSRFCRLDILSPNVLHRIYHNAKTLFSRLSDSDDGLDARGYRFRVGAAKIMNFLFPELFVIMDSNVLRGLNLREPSFQNYWRIMSICHDELLLWKSEFGDLDSLLCLDQNPTTLTRIFDKCAFIMGLKSL